MRAALVTNKTITSVFIKSMSLLLTGQTSLADNNESDGTGQSLFSDQNIGLDFVIQFLVPTAEAGCSHHGRRN
jgi:hypothetical protein